MNGAPLRMVIAVAHLAHVVMVFEIFKLFPYGVHVPAVHATAPECRALFRGDVIGHAQQTARDGVGEQTRKATARIML